MDHFPSLRSLPFSYAQTLLQILRCACTRYPSTDCRRSFAFTVLLLVLPTPFAIVTLCTSRVVASRTLRTVVFLKPQRRYEWSGRATRVTYDLVVMPRRLCTCSAPGLESHTSKPSSRFHTAIRTLHGPSSTSSNYGQKAKQRISGR